MPRDPTSGVARAGWLSVLEAQQKPIIHAPRTRALLDLHLDGDRDAQAGLEVAGLQLRATAA